MMLRNYQHAVIEQVNEALASGIRRIVLSMPTGAGKTVTAAALIHEQALAGKRSLFIVDRIELVDQAADHLERVGLRVGILQGERTCLHPDDEVVVASIQTIRRRNAPIGSQDDGEPTYTGTEKRNWYQALMWYGTRHNFNKPKGWAYYAFKEKFSEKPSWDWRDLPPVEPTELQIRWIKHYFIKSRKRYEKQKREAKTCPSCGGDRFTITAGKGPHAAGKRCDNCGKHLGWIPKSEVDNDRHDQPTF
jgi:hypothetical protein